MYTALLKSLNIERREANMVFLLISQSFFIGVFFATLENSSTTLFIMQYGEGMLGVAYTVSGVLGMLFTGIYSFLQGRIRFSLLLTINLLFISTLTFTMWYSYRVTSWEWLNFTIFSLMGALYILSLVGFSGMASRLFSLRQGKRLFSIIDSGLVFGMILISLAIPVILEIIPELNDLILISAISIFLAFVFQSFITQSYDVNKSERSEKLEVVKAERAGLNKFISDKYIRLMTLFVIFSMITLFLTAYNFLAVGKISYPEERDFAQFFAQFIIAVMAFSFILKTFVYSKLIKTYGLKVSLLVVPVLIGLFAVVAGVVGGVFGYETDTASFVIFFLLLSLVRFFSINLKDSIQTPTLRLLFQPIDIRIRYNVQTKVEGLVNEFSAVFSGLLLAGLGTLAFMELIHFSYLLIGVIGVWIYITVQLYKEYQNMLRNSLIEYKEKQKSERIETTDKRTGSEPSDEKSLKKIERLLEILKDYEPTLFDIKLAKLLQDNSIQAKELAIKSIDESEVFSAINELKKIAKQDANPGIKKRAEEVRSNLEKSFKEMLDEEKIIYLAKSKNFKDRVKAAKIIGYSENIELSSLLKTLMRDLDPQVKMQAIRSVVRLNNKELWPALIDQLSNEQYRSAAESAITEVGESILENLERSFYKSGAVFESLISVIELYGRIGGEKATKYLIKKLNDPNGKIVLTALHSLRQLNYTAEDEGIINQVYQAIELNAGVASWNLAAKHDIDVQQLSPQLSLALEKELHENHNMIFLLLSLIYDPVSIKHIRENIESGTTEGVSFAIEMLDLFIAEQLKSFLFPLFEDNKDEDKIKELELHFPINVYGDSDVLKQIMNRSANYLSHFTRACAVFACLKLEGEERKITNDIIANLFNPDPLLMETAAIVMNTIDPDSYDLSKERLSPAIQESLEKSIKAYGSNELSLLIEKVIFLNKVKAFENQNQRLLEDLALEMQYKSCDVNTELLKSNTDNNYIFIIDGNLSFKTAHGKMTFGPNEMINDMIFTDADKDAGVIIADSKVNYFEISNLEFKSLLFKYPQLGDVMLHIFDQRLNMETTSA